jgi:hypothetical protein
MVTDLREQDALDQPVVRLDLLAVGGCQAGLDLLVVKAHE